MEHEVIQFNKRQKIPFEYVISPSTVDEGKIWISLSLKNIGVKPIRRINLDVHSLDSQYITVLTDGHYINELKPGETEEIAFRISAKITSSIYITIKAFEENNFFYWESPDIMIRVAGTSADLLELFVLREKTPHVGDKIDIEVNVKGVENATRILNLEFYADTPTGEFVNLAKIQTKQLKAGEEATYCTEFTPEKKGAHVIYAYLFDGKKRIGKDKVAFTAK